MMWENPFFYHAPSDDAVKIGNALHQPSGSHSRLMGEILIFLEQRKLPLAPYFRGTDDQGRDVLEYPPGAQLGARPPFSDSQCVLAALITARLHRHLRHMESCPEKQTVCHGNLSPANFLFEDGIPTAVSGWERAYFGDPMDDFALEVWLWLDLGNSQIPMKESARRITLMMDAYDLPQEQRQDFINRIALQMYRARQMELPDRQQTDHLQKWAQECLDWLVLFKKSWGRKL